VGIGRGALATNFLARLDQTVVSNTAISKPNKIRMARRMYEPRKAFCIIEADELALSEIREARGSDAAGKYAPAADPHA
jgi:hypothetical protein